jgi:hypothetical protein
MNMGIEFGEKKTGATQLKRVTPAVVGLGGNN